MISPVKNPDTADAGSARAIFESAFDGLDAEGRAFLLRAQDYAVPIYEGKLLGTGEPVLDHAQGLVESLAALRLDVSARAAGLLFAVPEYQARAAEALTEHFDATVASLVGGVSRLNRLHVVTRGLGASDKNSRQTQAEVLRKMLLAMVEDIRVVLIRLASRTQTLRYLARSKGDAAMRLSIAQETLDVYAPLANRLGVWQLKWELEDLSFRFIEPQTYKKIAGMLDQRRVEREDFIAHAIETLSAELKAAGIEAEVSGRPKHIYSIYNKMRGKGLDFNELFDVLALRVLAESVRDCYAVLGVVHHLWQPVPSEFDDYISRPKANNYRSLHTAVIGPDERALEVQIRTREMHRHSELGVAAHWRYKEASLPGSKGARSDEAYDDKIAWLRQMLAWRDEVVGSAEWVEQAKRAALDDAVYVLTPQGRVIDLPAGATPVDFAYALHTDLGHHCRGAKVDGQMVPLDYKLQNGQSVEIVAAKTGGPSRDWLNPQLGYLQSSRGRNKVRQWFNAEEMARTIATGRTAVERELQREGATKTNLDQLAQALGFAKTEEFFAAFGREEIGPRALHNALHGDGGKSEAADEEVVTRKSKAGESAVLIVGVDRLMTQLARCCRPVPPDPIIGFVTRGRGISVHRRGCKSLTYSLSRSPERAIEAEWGKPAAGKQNMFPVDILVNANDRQGLLRDISEVLSRERLNVTAVNTLSRQHIATMAFTVEVADLAHLQRAIAQVEEVSDVLSARRR